MTQASTTRGTPTGAPTSRRWQTWAAILAGWALLSVLLAPELYFYTVYRMQPLPWREVLALTAASTLVAAVFGPAILWLTRRFPFDRERWRRSLLVHVPACIVFSVSHSGLYTLVCYASPELSRALYVRFHPNLITYWGIVAATAAFDYFERYRERERQLAEARMELLRQQLHPHFLFNTLNTIAAMMHEDVAGADRMLSQLSDLLRMTLDSLGSQEVSLQRELALLDKYLEIEHSRYQDRLALSREVDPATLDALVPPMILQPLVENSIRHGFGLDKGPLAITVRARRHEDRLALEVADNGRGLPAGRAQPVKLGLGLGNARTRLQQLYGVSHRFVVANGNAGGVTVSLEIPFRPAFQEAT